MSSRAEPESERAISTIWRSPTRRLPTDRPGVDVDLELLEDLRRPAGSSRASETMPLRLGSRPREMFSATLSVEASWNSWKMMATPRSRAWRGPSDGVGAAVHDDLAGIGLVVAGDDLDERGLAGTVLTEQGQHGTADSVEVHTVEDLDAAEGLADLTSLELEAHGSICCDRSVND